MQCETCRILNHYPTHPHVLPDMHNEVVPYMWRLAIARVEPRSELEESIIYECAGGDVYTQIMSCMPHLHSSDVSNLTGHFRKTRGRLLKTLRHLATAFARRSKVVNITRTTPGQVYFHHSLEFYRDWYDLVTVTFDDGLIIDLRRGNITTHYSNPPHFESLLQCGDIESNPGPAMSKMTSEELCVAEKEMKCQIRRSQAALKKKNAQMQKIIEHKKDRSKQSRKLAALNKREDAAFAEGFMENARECAAAGAEHLRPVLQALHGAILKIDGAAEKATNFAGLGDHFSLSAFITSLISVVSGIMGGSMVTTTVNLVHLAKLIGLDAGVLSGWLSPSPDDTGSEEKAKAEGDDDVEYEESFLGKARHQIVILFSFISNVFSSLCGKVPTLAVSAALLTTIGRASLGWRSIHQAASWLFSHIASVYYRCIYGMTPEEYNLSQRFPELEELYAASKFVVEIPKGVIDGSSAVCSQILGLSARIDEMLQVAMKSRDERFSKFVLGMKLLVKANVDNARKSPAIARFLRSEPFALYIYGKPGVGKSVMLDVLKSDVYKNLIPEADRPAALESVRYTRLSANEYWEGYAGQPIVVMDDFGCLTDSTSQPNMDYLDALRIINTAPYPLHMATLSEKANTFFVSPFFMVTSNQAVPPVACLANPEALYRRFHMWIEVKCKKEYGVQVKRNSDVYYKFDAGVAQNYCASNGIEHTPLMTDQYQIDVYTVDQNGVTHKTDTNMGYDAFWNKYSKAVKEHRTKNDHLEQAFHARAGTTPIKIPQTESEVLRGFAKIYKLNTLVTAVATQDEAETFKDAEEESKIEDPLDELSKSPSGLRSKIKEYWQKINAWKASAKKAIEGFLEKIKEAVNATTSSATGLALILFGILASAMGKMKELGRFAADFLTQHPWISALGMCLSLGMAYAGYKWWKTSRVCAFAKYPSHSQPPCQKCSWCNLVDFPPTGDRLEHLARVISSADMCDRLAELAEVTPSVLSSRVMGSVYAQGRVYDPDVRRRPSPAIAEAMIARSPISIGSVAHAEGSVVYVEQLQATMVKNAVRMETIGTNGKVCRANGVFLMGRVALTTYHTLVPVDFVARAVRIRNPYAGHDSIEIPYSDLNITQCTDANGRFVDLALVTFSGMVPNRRNILSRFIAAKDVPAIDEGEVVMVGFVERGGILATEEQSTYNFGVTLGEKKYTMHPDDKCPFSGKGGQCMCDKLRVASHISYKLSSGPGRCGSLIAVRGAPTRACIIGMHVAGGQHAYAGVLTREFLQRNVDNHVRAGTTQPDDLIDGATPYAEGLVSDLAVPSLMERGGDCLAIGIAPQPHVPTKTVLQPSLVSGSIFAPTSAPAKLSPQRRGGVEVDPMLLGMDKVMKTQTFISRHLVDIAVQDVFAMFPRGGRVLTYEEGIRGVAGDPYIRPINRSTSPGYPYNLNNPGPGKTAWLGSGEEYDVSHAGLRADVEDLIERGKRLERGSAISIATLKDERRPMEKVELCKTRVFEACPMHLVLAIRMYYLAFAAVVMRNRIECESCVGVNPYSSEWTHMAVDLLARGDNMIAGDFSNYDGSLLYQILTEIGRAINKWYDDGTSNANVRASLWEHISSADVLVRGSVIRQTHSQPSGNPLTVIINSIYNSVIMRIAYLSMKSRAGMPVLCDFRTYVKMLSYGDDNVLSVSPAIISWFNQISISNALRELGMIYTTEDKEDAVMPSKTLNRTTFLKRSFRDAGYGWIMAPMSVENIIEMTNWVRGKQVKLRTKENCEFALMELSYHDEKTYNKFSRELQQACDRVGITLRVPIYAEWMSQHMYDLAYYETHPYVPLWSVPEPVVIPDLSLQEEKRETVLITEAESTTESVPPTLLHDGAIAEGETSTANVDQEISNDTVRGQIMTDIQASVNETPMDSTTTIRALNDRTHHELTDLLVRPVVLGHYTWSSTDNALPTYLSKANYDADAQNYLQKWDFPQAIFSQSPLIVEKAKNFQYFKADVEIELKVNAQPFLAGALGLVYNPYYDHANGFRRKGTRFLASQTSCPYKMISLENGNSMKLTCPYANVKDLFDLDDPDHQFGTVFLYVLADLFGSTEPVSVSYTVFARFVNPQFYVPTHRNVLSASIQQHQVNALTRLGWKLTPPEAYAEGDMGAAPDTGETKKSGPISTIAGAVGTVAGALTNVPVIGSIASTVSWVARAVGGVASVFGFSKPARADSHGMYVMKPGFSMVHTEGYDDAITMALLQDNGIDGSSIVPSTKDEMSLSYIFERPNIFYRLTVTSTQFRNQVLLMKWEVSPFTQYQHLDTVNPESLFLGSFAYSAMMGTLWRGTIIYDIFFVKTCFHQGRVAIVYLPETNMSDVPTSLGTLLTTNYAKVVNLREVGTDDNRSVVRLPIPYISNTPWKKTVLFDAQNQPASGTTETTNGCVAIYALTDLSAPDTVAQGLQLLISHSGGEDFEISRPLIQLCPGYEGRGSEAFAEGDIGEVVIPDREDILVPDTVTSPVTAQTTGEYFESLRAYMKRSAPVCVFNSTIDTMIGLKPHLMMEGSSGNRIVRATANTTGHVLMTPFYMASFLYRFWNGSTVVRLPATTFDHHSLCSLSVDSEFTNALNRADVVTTGLIHQQRQTVSGIAEYRIPYYQDVRCGVVGSQVDNPQGSPRLNVAMRHTYTGAASYLFESAGDDFNFFFLIGPPPMRSIGLLPSISNLPLSAAIKSDVKIDFSTLTSYANTVDKDGDPCYDFYPLAGPKQQHSSVQVIEHASACIWGANTQDDARALALVGQDLVYNHDTNHYALRIPASFTKSQLDSYLAAGQQLGEVSLRLRSPGAHLMPQQV